VRFPVIAGNWKMNTTFDEATALVKDMKDSLDFITGVEKVVCPPFISLAVIKGLLWKSSIQLGAQNMYFEEKGAYTGEISPVMLAGLCQFVILGHSERRHYFGESDELINKKIKAALKVGLKPIVCVGETLEQHEAGRTDDVVITQTKGALDGVVASADIVIAYEPVWAIGTGKASSGEAANATIGIIRQTLAKMYGKEIAQARRIQYGGSVTAQNIAEFIRQPEIDGALVGGASLKAKEFVSMVEQAAAIKGKK
jgi:triosephosphate isomerase (TIM)